MTPSSDTNVKITTSLIPAPRVVAGTLREANTGSPIRVTDSRGRGHLDCLHDRGSRLYGVHASAAQAPSSVRTPINDQAPASCSWAATTTRLTRSAPRPQQTSGASPNENPNTTGSSLRFGLNVEP